MIRFALNTCTHERTPNVCACLLACCAVRGGKCGEWLFHLDQRSHDPMKSAAKTEEQTSLDRAIEDAMEAAHLREMIAAMRLQHEREVCRSPDHPDPRQRWRPAHAGFCLSPPLLHASGRTALVAGPCNGNRRAWL